MSADLAQTAPLVRIIGARVTFGSRNKVHAVAGVDLEIGTGEVLAIVGESGSGKSTLARAVVGLQKLTSGRIEFSQAHGQPHHKVVQMVFQDPRASLNPRLTVRQVIEEAWHGGGNGANKQERQGRILTLIEDVGISSTMLDSYPANLSGGQCQRISIARALANRPQLLVCDEVVSALDVSIQAQVLDLLRELKDRQNLAMLFITHDLGVVRQLADRVAVMYKGEIVEIGQADDIFMEPRHPYTQRLLSSAMDLVEGNESQSHVEVSSSAMKKE